MNSANLRLLLKDLLLWIISKWKVGLRKLKLDHIQRRKNQQRSQVVYIFSLGKDIVRFTRSSRLNNKNTLIHFLKSFESNSPRGKRSNSKEPPDLPTRFLSEWARTGNLSESFFLSQWWQVWSSKWTYYHQRDWKHPCLSLLCRDVAGFRKWIQTLRMGSLSKCQRTENPVSWSFHSKLELRCLSQSKFLVQTSVKTVPRFSCLSSTATEELN